MRTKAKQAATNVWPRGGGRAAPTGVAQAQLKQAGHAPGGPLDDRYPYLLVDAKLEEVRQGGRLVPKCVVVAPAVHETGRREAIGVDVGEAEIEAFWREFLRSLVKRGLNGVRLAIADAHPGLKAALASPWQRRTVHFLRDCRVSRTLKEVSCRRHRS